MSTEIYDGGELHVNRYCGPRLSDLGADRRRWQFTLQAGHGAGQFVSLGPEAVRALAKTLLKSLGEDDPFDCPRCGGNDQTGGHERWCDR